MEPLNDQERQTVADNLGLAGAVARGLMHRRDVRRLGEFDDVVHYGVIGLCRAVRLFDPARGVMLSTFATVCIRHEILRAADSVRRRLWPGELTEEPESSAASGPDQVEQQDQVEAIQAAVGELPPRDADILRRRFYERQALKAVAREMGISKQRVQQIEARAVGRLRDVLAEVG